MPTRLVDRVSTQLPLPGSCSFPVFLPSFILSQPPPRCVLALAVVFYVYSRRLDVKWKICHHLDLQRCISDEKKPIY